MAIKNLNPVSLTVTEEYHGERADKFIACASELDLSRSLIQRLIKDGNIRINEAAVKQNHRVRTNDKIDIYLPEPEDFSAKPQELPLDIVYEDSSIIVINKQPGLVVHPGPGNWDGTLVNGLLFHCRDIARVGEALRPGIVHRLDKDTAGLLVAAKNDTAHKRLSEAFAQRRINKRYAAIVSGRPRQGRIVIDAPIARHRIYRHKMTVAPCGREALTECILIKSWLTQNGVFSLLDVKIHTGRTHQIRVHLSSLGLPVVGDPIYSKKREKYETSYLLLASVELGFEHPETEEPLVFKIPLPEHIKAFADKLDAEAKAK